MRLVVKSSADNFGVLMDFCVYKNLTEYASAILDCYRTHNPNLVNFLPRNFDIDGHYLVKDEQLTSEVNSIMQALGDLPESSLSLIGDSISANCNIAEKSLSFAWELIWSPD